MKYLRPQIDKKANSSLDVDGFLNDVMEEDPGKDLYLLGADQSFEATVWSQMLQRPGHFCVFVTIACLLHIMMWLLCALWQLGRTTVLYGFVRKLNFDSLGDARLYQKFRTDDYNYYRSFTLKWVDGVGQYFRKIAGDDRLEDAAQMMEDCKHNKGMRMLLEQWLLMLSCTELRRMVQGHQHDNILAHLTTAFHILRCTNHYNVCNQIVRMQWYLLVLHPAHIELYKSEMTKSITGKPGRGVSINHPVEDLNQRGNRKGKGLRDPRVLSDVSVCFNGAIPVEDTFKDFMRIDWDLDAEYLGSHYKTADEITKMCHKELGSVYPPPASSSNPFDSSTCSFEGQTCDPEPEREEAVVTEPEQQLQPESSALSPSTSVVAAACIVRLSVVALPSIQSLLCLQVLGITWSSMPNPMGCTKLFPFGHLSKPSPNSSPFSSTSTV